VYRVYVWQARPGENTTVMLADTEAFLRFRVCEWCGYIDPSRIRDEDDIDHEDWTCESCGSVDFRVTSAPYPRAS
jgi:hypothetical protein